MSAVPQRLPTGSAVSCREMVEADCAAVTPLLTKAFARWRDGAFWRQALERLAARSPVSGLPRFGYVLAAGEQIVGVLLVIASERRSGGKTLRRCNVSSWYVEPAFRVYASLLVTKALRHPGVTYTNVTPAPETWKLLLAQGYRQFVDGRAVGIPLLARRSSRSVVRQARPDLISGDYLSEDERSLLLDHARWGCLTMFCDTPCGKIPFVFGVRRRRGVKFAYLLYCRDLEGLVEHARPLGRYLALRGIGFVVADANSRLAGMPGWFEPGYPKFYRGDPAPDPGDLAYTERAVFGV